MFSQETISKLAFIEQTLISKGYYEFGNNIHVERIDDLGQNDTGQYLYCTNNLQDPFHGIVFDHKMIVGIILTYESIKFKPSYFHYIAYNTHLFEQRNEIK